MANKFWMVWNPNRYAPTVKHETARLARIEAERLARHNPCERFYVLEAIALRYVDNMQRIDFGGVAPRQDDDLPF